MHLLFLLAVLPQFVDVRRADAGDMLLVTMGILLITIGTARLLELRRHWIGRARAVALLGFAALAALGVD